MIIGYIHQRRKPVAGVLAWFIAAQITLPVFAGIPNSNLRPGYENSAKSIFIKQHELQGMTNFNARPQEVAASRIKLKPRPSQKTSQDFVLHSSGPSQPEMSSFKSVGTENMVDPFSGDFSYNIPLLDVGGYPISIHYNSNITMDQEASWVGLGWNINPGTIARNMRGLPDDFNGVDSIKKTVSTKPNLSLGVNGGANVEFLGYSGGSVNVGINYNNYKGYGIDGGISIKSPISKAGKAAGGTLSGTLSLSNSSMDGASFSGNVGLGYSSEIKDKINSLEYGIATNAFAAGINYNSRAGLTSLTLDANISATKNKQGGSFGIPASISFARPTYMPGTEIQYTSLNTSFNLKTGASFFTVFKNASIGAQLSVQYIAPKDTSKIYPAYGYLSYSKATAGNDKDALLDYNRNNDGVFVDKVTPAIAIPNYTYDVYSISAEGTGGSFRPYRSDIGYIYSAYNKTNSGQLNVGLDVGIKHFGANVKPVYSNTITKAWLADNKLKNFIRFQQKDSVFEDVVFRNPLEMPVQSESFLQAIAHDTLIRPVLEGRGANATLANSFAVMENGINTSEVRQVKSKIFKDKRE